MVTHESAEEVVAKVFEHNPITVFDAVNASTMKAGLAVENYLMAMCIVRCHGELPLEELCEALSRRLRVEVGKK